MNEEVRFPTDKYFFDTCSLLLAGEKLFEEKQPFVISSITFKELERIKTSSNKDVDVKYSARILLHLFDEHPELYTVIVHTIDHEDAIIEKNLDITDDTRILSDAIALDKTEDVVFITNDLSLKAIAGLFFGDGMIASVPEENDNYTGYKELTPTEEQLSCFYSDTTKNWFSLLSGEYLILRDENGNVIDIRAWTGEDHRFLNTKPFSSNWFGKVSPWQGDTYQKLLFDSLHSNKITMVKGPAGSGKTQVSLSFLMSELEHHNLDKIIVFCNTVATANSAKLGYYPGTKNEKLLDSQIGNLLASKFGGKDGINSLIEQEKIVLLPMSDIRGYDTTGMKAGIYISEAQNLDRTLMKLALQRVGDDCICIIDGDNKQQVDDIHFAGANNGMRKASQVYRGHNIYGEISLKNIYRSEIARIAEKI